MISRSEVDLNQAVRTIDNNLIHASWLELKPITNVLDRIHEEIQYLHRIASDCRHGGIGLSTTQSARVSKLCDLLESVPPSPMASTTEVQGYQSCLLDGELMTSYITKVRSKLKMVEEITSSKKNENIRFRSSASSNVGIFDLSVIKDIAKQIMMDIEFLESQCEARGGILGYFSMIKQAVHQPVQEVTTAMKITPLKAEIEDELKKELANLESFRKQYAEARSSEWLVRLAEVRREMIRLEDRVRDLWNRVPDSLLRQVLNDIGDSAWTEALLGDYYVLFLRYAPVAPVACCSSVGVASATNSGVRSEEMARKTLEGLITNSAGYERRK